MQNVLTKFGIVPVTSSMLASLYSRIWRINAKIADLEAKSEIIRLKHDLFVVSPEITGKKISTGLIANHLYTPSYVSMYSALRYYGLIPEMGHVTQSLTVGKAKHFDNVIGSFDYIHTDSKTFPLGVTQAEFEGISFLIASPEKALCDLIAETRGLNLRYKVDVKRLLNYDLHFDMDFFRTANKEIFMQYAATGKKAKSIKTLLNWI